MCAAGSGGFHAGAVLHTAFTPVLPGLPGLAVSQQIMSSSSSVLSLQFTLHTTLLSSAVLRAGLLSSLRLTCTSWAAAPGRSAGCISASLPPTVPAMQEVRMQHVSV